MKLEQKHIILIVGSVLVLTAIGVGIYLLTRNRDEKNSEETANEGDVKNGPIGGPAGGNTTPPGATIDPGKVIPQFNDENELKNPLSQLKGKVLYPKRKYLGGWDYTNVRSSTEVNTNQGWWDGYDNLITTINAGTPIGYVEGEATGVHNSYSYRWFKVKLIKPVTKISAFTFWRYSEGYVRADTVTFIAYDK